MPLNEDQIMGLKQDLAEDPAARLKFIAHTVTYLEGLGIPITDDIARKLEPDAIEASARLKGNPLASTNIVITTQ